MVIEDSCAPNPQKNEFENTTSKGSMREADPFDRFAARVLDLVIILIPIVGLFLAPFSRKISEFYILGSWTDLTFQVGLMAIISGACFCLYHGISESFFGASFGKRLMKLEVVDIWDNQKISLWRGVFRNFYVLLQTLSLGFLYLLVMTNKKHRGLHDQLCDTWVVSNNDRAPQSYRLWPLQFFMRFSVVVVLAVVVPVSVKMGLDILNSLDLDELFSRSNFEKVECQELESLEEGMSLVATGSETVKCLKPFVDAEFIEGANPSALAYLVKSFLHVEQADLSDEYLDQVCKVEAGSPACLLSQIISAWSDGRIDEINTILDESKDVEEPYLDLWALRYFQQSGHFEKTLAVVQKLEPYPYLNDYVLSEKARAQYLLGQVANSESVVRDLLRTDPDSSFTQDLLSWSCQNQIEKSCDNSGHEFCLKLEDMPAQANTSNLQVILGQMRLNECHQDAEGQARFRMAKYTSESAPSYWTDFVYGLNKSSKGDSKSAWAIWKRVALNDETPDFLRAEVIRRMLIRPELSEIETLSLLLGSIETYEYRRTASLKVAATFRNLNLMDLANSIDESGEINSQRSPASKSEEQE